MSMFSNRFFITIILFFSSFFNEVWAATSQSWQLAIVSEEITGNSADKDFIGNVQQYFADKK